MTNLDGSINYLDTQEILYFVKESTILNGLLLQIEKDIYTGTKSDLDKLNEQVSRVQQALDVVRNESNNIVIQWSV